MSLKAIVLPRAKHPTRLSIRCFDFIFSPRNLRFALGFNMGFLAQFAALFVVFGASAAAGVAAQDTLVSCLRSSLSAEGSVYVAGDGNFTTDTIRWNRNHEPTFKVVVAVANEHDVRVSVRYYTFPKPCARVLHCARPGPN